MENWNFKQIGKLVLYYVLIVVFIGYCFKSYWIIVYEL